MLLCLVKVNSYWLYITVSVAITGSMVRLFGASLADVDTRFYAPFPIGGDEECAEAGAHSFGHTGYTPSTPGV